MLKSSKSMISTIHDQLINVINKIQNFYQRYHHHYYFNDLFYMCNIKKPNKRQKSRNQTKKSKNKPKKIIFLNKSSNNSSDNNINENSNTNSVANVCYCCTNYKNCRSINFKIISHISYDLPNICFNFKNSFNNLQLVLVIFLLALITTTAYSINTQGRADKIKINITKSIHTKPCHIPNGLRDTEVASLKFKSNICQKLRHIYHHRYHYNGVQTHQQLQNHSDHHLFTINKNSTHWFANSYHNNSETIHYANDHQRSQQQVEKFNYNTKTIKFENNEDERTQKSDTSNMNKLLQHIPRNDRNIFNSVINTNDNYNTNNKSISNNNRLTVIVKNISEETRYEYENEKNSNDISKDHVEVYVNDDHVEINNSYASLNLLLSVNDTLQSVFYMDNQTQYQQQQPQYIDDNKLMKLVMDGLGLKKTPNMKVVNISQEEYVTKYRQYLQRVHTRKRQEIRDVLGEYDENILRPLEILSIVSSSSLHNDINVIRMKRNSAILNKNDEVTDDGSNYDDDNRKQSLEERVKNILFLKKKYLNPRSTKKERDERKTNIRLMFALKPDIFNLSSSDIEEANIRLVLLHSPILAIRNSKNKKTNSKPKSNSCCSYKSVGQKNPHQANVVNLKLYFLSKSGKRVWIDGRKVDIVVDNSKPDETHTQWLQFDVLKAVKTIIEDKRQQHVLLELQCDNCKRIGARILNDAYNTAADALADDLLTEDHQLMPVLNIIAHLDHTNRSMRRHKYENHYSDIQDEATTQRHYHHQTHNNNRNKHNRRTNCYKANQRCCRHSMEVIFKEIKGFEFIIQPKVFDAGYCNGRCPPRYNPAHHHAMLQSLIWKQNHQKAPRPCCAPTKLVELEVLHVDEKDSEKLKISTWSDMKVAECACS